MFRLEVARSGDVPVLALHGELDHDSVVQLDGAADTSLAEGGAPLSVVDCSAPAFCDSCGIGGLVRLYQRLCRDGAVLRGAAPPPSVRRVFALTGSDRAIAVHPTLDAALAWAVRHAVPDGAAAAAAGQRAVGEGRRTT